MPIEGSFGVWADTGHKEILKAISTWVQTKKFGERKAQTVAERNALKQHPALSLQLGDPQGPVKNRWLETLVIGWQHDHDYRELEEIALAADAGEEIVIDGRAVETIVDSGKIEEVDVYAADEGDLDDISSGQTELKEGLF